MPPRQLDLIIGELGPESADIHCVAATGPATWAVQFDNDAVVHLAWRLSPPRLELMTAVARLPAAADREVMRAILMFNFLSLDTGGVRMGLSAEDDTVFLIRDLPGPELSLSAVQDAMRAMAGLATQWARILGVSATSPDSPDAPALRRDPATAP
jgi:hypothetical protein